MPKNTEHCVIGLRESLKMLRNNKIASMTLAKDSDAPLIKEVLILCEKNDIPIEWVEKKKRLGENVGISRPASAVGWLR